MTLYGIFQDSNCSISKSELEIFLSEGFLTLKNIISKEDLHSLIELTYKYLEIQEFDASNSGIDLSAIKENDLLRCPLAYDRLFYESLCLNPVILNYVKAILGDNIQIHLQNAIVNRPSREHHQSTWHRDIPYQPFLPSRPMSLGVLFCLTPFNPLTGGTFFVPGSHRFYDVDLTESELEKIKVCPELDSGDVVLFDSFVWHRAGLNSSAQDRIGINNMFTTPILKQQISIPDLLPSGYCQTEEDKKLLGFQWQEPRSVKAFREKRMSK